MTNAIPVEYSYMLPSGQWPASSARVKIDAKWIGQPISTRAMPTSPSQPLAERQVEHERHHRERVCADSYPEENQGRRGARHACGRV